MPHIQIKLFKGKTEEEKQQLATELMKAAQKVLGLEDKSYSVAIEDFLPEEWKGEVYEKEIMAREDLLYKKPGYKM
ncbi:4-oxalocrotonate tautomerase [Maribellus comscasis]|uniref:4-oxalocrotonate tautomerase n=1 Tax=Maribellus comscasis TaxID=2681766 RepID=A0A6I6JQK2_9BACT|nr:tautomerase family protein [Maribellus comscasis]QGY42492.1 4-oxalocrotonate tautomerase [Maribellus comscasis]